MWVCSDVLDTPRGLVEQAYMAHQVWEPADAAGGSGMLCIVKSQLPVHEALVLLAFLQPFYASSAAMCMMHRRDAQWGLKP